MFEISQLTQALAIEKVIEVDCLSEPGATITIEITDKIREEERKLSDKYFQYVIKYRGKGTRSQQEGHVRSNQLGYCLELVDLCLKDSTGLFSDGGSPVAHNIDAFKSLLKRYKPFLEWFSNAVTKAFSDDAQFKREEDEALEKN